MHDAFHVVAGLPELNLYVLQMPFDDVHAEVEYQVHHTLSQSLGFVLHFKGAAELVTIDGKITGKLTDMHIGMVHEICLGAEPLIIVVLYGLGQNAVVQFVGKVQTVL